LFYIYAIFNNINKKYYIGKTNDVNKRLKEHIGTSLKPKSNSYSYIHRAINKYGKENFEIFTLDSFENEEECYEFETKYITLLNSSNSNIGYNMNCGGSGGINPNAEVRKKISDKRKGFKFSPEAIQKMIDSHIGQISHLRRISNDQVLQIREIFAYCNAHNIKINYDVLYDQYNLKHGAILNIAKNITYKEVVFDNPYKDIISQKISNKKERKPLGLFDTKICSKCKESKLTTEFTPSTKLICGFESHCKKCNSSYPGKRRSVTKEKKINRMTYGEVNLVYYYWDLGKSIKEINKLVKISNINVCAILNSEFKICSRPPENINCRFVSKNEINKFTKQQIINEYLLNKTADTISKELNFTEYFVQFVLKNANLL